MMLRCIAIPLSDVTSVGAARRAGLNLGVSLGFNAVKNGELGIIITEAARNAVLHGGGGLLFMSAERINSCARAEVLALDRGPGIKDLVRAFQDGYSTAGTPGTGLGAIRRLASTCDVFSSAGGTAIVATVVQGEATGATPALEIGTVLVPFPGETVCGDGIAWVQEPNRTAALMVDGLGHGLQAAEAADEAIATFHQHAKKQPGEIVGRIHDALRKTRGAAVAVAEILTDQGSLNYAGVGNISGSVLAGSKLRSLISHNGTAGHQVIRIQEFKSEWPSTGVLILHSDGLQTRWDLSKYPGLLQRHPTVIAGVLVRDHSRGRDDASVLVVKERG
jgi:anti-sigma regulatory factor (Ser/Thr protein kinase)